MTIAGWIQFILTLAAVTAVVVLTSDYATAGGDVSAMRSIPLVAELLPRAQSKPPMAERPYKPRPDLYREHIRRPRRHEVS